MALLPPRFHDAISAAPLGPVVKRTEDPVMHVHDWRPSASSKDHVTCSCGQVSLREFVMPKDDFAPTQPSGAWASPEELEWPDLGPEAKFEAAIGGLKEADLEFPTLDTDALQEAFAEVFARTPKRPGAPLMGSNWQALKDPFAIRHVKVNPEAEALLVQKFKSFMPAKPGLGQSIFAQGNAPAPVTFTRPDSAANRQAQMWDDEQEDAARRAQALGCGHYTR